MHKVITILVLILILGAGRIPAVLFAVDTRFGQYRQTLLDEIARQKSIIKGKPESAKAHFQLGLSLMRLGRHQEEIEAYQEAVRLKEDFADAYENLSIANDRLHDGVNAIHNAIKALELYTNKRKHRKIRATQRRLRFLYEKYGYKPKDFKSP